MASDLDIFLRVEHRHQGLTRGIGSLSEPFRHSSAGVAELTTAGSQVVKTTGIIVPAGQTIVVWDYLDLPIDPALFVVACDELAYCFLHADKPTSDADQTPLGTHVHAFQFPAAAGMPAVIAGRALLVVPTATNPAAISAGEPTLPGLGTVATGRAYALSVHNAGATDIVTDLAIFA